MRICFLKEENDNSRSVFALLFKCLKGRAEGLFDITNNLTVKTRLLLVAKRGKSSNQWSVFFCAPCCSAAVDPNSIKEKTAIKQPNSFLSSRGTRTCKFSLSSSRFAVCRWRQDC